MINEAKRSRWRLALQAIGLFFAIITTVWGAAWASSNRYSGLQSDVERAGQRIEDHEQRLRSLEFRWSEIHDDLHFIRRSLEISDAQRDEKSNPQTLIPQP